MNRSNDPNSRNPHPAPPARSTLPSTRRARKWWFGFGVFAAFLVAGLVHISRVTLELEERNQHAAATMEQREHLRDALWTLDGYLSQILEDEADRGPRDEWFNPLPGQTFASPLVEDDRPLFLCRFETNPIGAPTLRDTVPEAWGNAPEPQKVAQSRAWVNDNDLHGAYNDAQMLSCSNIELTNNFAQNADPTFSGQIAPQAADLQIEQEFSGQDGVQVSNPAERDESTASFQTLVNGYGNPQRIDAESQSRRNVVSMKSRSQRAANVDTTDLNRSIAALNPTVDDTGLLLPHWSTVEGTRQLAFLRQVFRDGSLCVQGFTVDWPLLEKELLALAEPIIPGITFEPIVGSAARDIRWVGSSLASLPLGVDCPEVCAPEITGITPARLALGLTWFAVLGAIAIAFASLRSSVAFGERRSRFASAVTHELRTPLTTFQLYSEMLADGMVTDPAQKKEYLETLRSESKRLSGLVESVLSYSRLEEGRDERRRAAVQVGTLFDRIVPRFERTLEEAGLTLALELPDELRSRTVTTDADAIEQILTNLVENAAKYAAGSDPARVDLRVRHTGSHCEIEVRDHGPGIASGCAERIFAPFDRAGRESGSLPGAGLGLSIARALARDLGGELTLDSSGGTSADGNAGACFVLRLACAR